MSEASNAALLVNQISNTIVLNQTQFYVTIAVGSAIGSGIISTLIELAKLWYQNHLNKSNAKSLSKRQLADEVMKFCAESEQGLFQSPPRNSEHIAYIGNQLNRFDNTLSTKIKYLLYAWNMRTSSLIPKGLHDTLEKEIERTRQELIKGVSSL